MGKVPEMREKKNNKNTDKLQIKFNLEQKLDQ